MTGSAHSTPTTGRAVHTRVTWLLIAGYFLLRLIGLVKLPALVASSHWLTPVRRIGVYLLMALLVWWERERLSNYHFDRLALAIVILGKPFELLLYELQIPFAYPPRSSVHLLYLPISAGLLVALLISRPKLARLRAGNWRWVLIGAWAGVCLGLFSGHLLRLQWSDEGGSELTMLILAFLPIQQMVTAGISTEPIYRGFLWGALREAGWADVWVCMVQAGLFWAGHLFYLGVAPLSLWVLVPIAGLVLGRLAWRSRSIAVTMVAHGVANGVSQMVAYYQP
jgi:hypothetical protein